MTPRLAFRASATVTRFTMHGDNCQCDAWCAALTWCQRALAIYMVCALVCVLV